MIHITKWTDDLLKSELLKTMDALNINRMPTAKELKDIGRNDLHCRICRTKKYSGWAKELNLDSKHGTTRLGNEYETVLNEKLNEMGFCSERMTSKFPFDLLINGAIKIDVKVGKAHMLFGSRAHSFATNKPTQTSDIYILVAIDEQKNIENFFIIPSHLVRLKTINIGTKSKYNKYIDAWDYLTEFSIFYKKISI